MAPKRLSLLALLALLCTATACPSSKTSEPKDKSDSKAAATQSDAGSKADAAQEPPAPAPERSNKLACKAQIDTDGKINVDGKPTGLSLKPGTQIKATPYTTASILVAARSNWRSRQVTMDGRLWEVPCQKPQAHSEFFKLDGADFGNSALDRQGQTLYFTSTKGIGALTFESKAHKTVTTPPKLPQKCWDDPDSPRLALDVVVGERVSGNKLIFRRGGPCGQSGAWTAKEMHLIRPLDEKRRELRSPQPVSTVARTADGTLWLGDAGRCTEPGVIDPQSPGVVWRSKDEGESWEQVEVGSKEEKANTAIRVLVADKKARGTLLAMSARCGTAVDKVKGGTLYLTRNGGRSWSPIKMPEGLTTQAPDLGIFAFEVFDDDLRKLRIWPQPNTRWETTDGGRTWKSVPPRPLPRKQSRVTSNDTWTFRATSNGLLRKDVRSKRLKRVFPVRPTPPGSDDSKGSQPDPK